jgi:hypothetical protein
MFLSDEALRENESETSVASELLREALSYTRRSGDKRLSVYVMKNVDSARVFEAFRSAIQENLDITLTIYAWREGFPKLGDCKVIVLCDRSFRQDKVSSELPNEIKAKIEKYVCETRH